MAFTHTAGEVVGGNLQFVKVVATTTALSTTAAARDAVMNVISGSVQPFIVGDGYNIPGGSTSALLIAVPTNSLVAATVQTAIQATALTGLAGATVTITDTLVG